MKWRGCGQELTDLVANGRPPIDLFVTVVRCYTGNQLVELIATLAPLRPRDLDHQFAVAHGHFRGLAVAGTDFIGECFRHSQCEAVAPLLKCHLHLRSPTLMIQCRYGLGGSWSGAASGAKRSFVSDRSWRILLKNSKTESSNNLAKSNASHLA